MTQTPANIELRILDQRLRDWGLPRYQTGMAAAVDLLACIDAPMTVEPGAPAVLVPSGIAVHMADPGWAALILPRSGLGHRDGLVLGNLVGLIDADYTDEIKVSLWNRNPAGGPGVTIRPGDRIAQMMFTPVLRPSFAVVDEFSHGSDRRGGFGSTGVAGAGG